MAQRWDVTSNFMWNAREPPNFMSYLVTLLYAIYLKLIVAEVFH